MLATLTGCGSVRRHIGPDEHVLYKNVLDAKMADGSETTPEVNAVLAEAKSYYRQKPNSKVLGFDRLRVGMTIYGWTSPKDNSLWGRYWRSVGQAPRIYSEQEAMLTSKQLTGLLRSKGCFESTVTFDTAAIDGKDITICYHVRASQRYIVDEVEYYSNNADINKLIERLRSASLLKTGVPYDQDNLVNERARIVSELRDEGFFSAKLENITFRVDTTYDERKLSIEVLIDGSGLKVYHINNVFIYPEGGVGPNSDTLIHVYNVRNRPVDFSFVHSEPLTLNPQTISRVMMLFPGMTYRQRFVTSTYNSLRALRCIKYADITFTESPASNDTSPLLDAHVRLIRQTQQRLSLSAEFTNASPLTFNDSASFIFGGNLGIEAAMEYQHNNLFGGAELLNLKLSGLFELPKQIFSSQGGTFYDHFDAFETGIDLSLDMPVFLLPFANNISWQRIKPHTTMSLGANYQYRYIYERVLANTTFGYTWNSDRNTQHQLLPVDLTFVRIIAMDNTYFARIQNDLRLKYQYSDHFILGARYAYAHTTQQTGTRQDFSVIHFNVESAGNLLDAASGLLGAVTDENGVSQIFGSPYAQYVRFGGEYTRYHYLPGNSTFVSRIMLGVGLPYGNSVAMPYEKSFFGGGPTTMRAWQLRRLGPGSYNAVDSAFERVGDLQLVLNLEGRFPIVSILEGAVFADMGNVWLLNESKQFPDGEIKWNSIPTEVAIGIGLGLRVNVSVTTLRLDFGIPLYDPSYAAGLRWRPFQTRWHLNQIVTNIGLNYPF